MVCSAGYPLVIVMAGTQRERRKMLRFGAKVVLTPAPEMGTGMLNKAYRTGGDPRLVPLCRQFEKSRPTPRCTPAPTAQEILADFHGKH